MTATLSGHASKGLTRSFQQALRAQGPPKCKAANGHGNDHFDYHLLWLIFANN